MLDFLEKVAKNTQNQYLIIMLHGWGSDKYDLISLDFDLDNLHYISVNAPFNCDNGFGYQWFSLKKIETNSIMLEIKNNYMVLADFIKEQSKRLNIDYNHIFLLGFSQGAMMSLYTGMRLKNKLAGIISLSGLLPDTIENIKNSAYITKQNILLLHGTDDDVVPYDYFNECKKMLNMLDFTVEAHTINGLAHGINDDEIIIIKNYLRSNIKNNIIFS